MSLPLSAGQRGHRARPETIHAERTKLRTLASTGWLLLGAIALTVMVSATAPASSHPVLARVRSLVHSA